MFSSANQYATIFFLLCNFLIYVDMQQFTQSLNDEQFLIQHVVKGLNEQLSTNDEGVNVKFVQLPINAKKQQFQQLSNANDNFPVQSTNQQVRFINQPQKYQQNLQFHPLQTERRNVITLFPGDGYQRQNNFNTQQQLQPKNTQYTEFPIKYYPSITAPRQQQLSSFQPQYQQQTLNNQQQFGRDEFVPLSPNQQLPTELFRTQTNLFSPPRKNSPIDDEFVPLTDNNFRSGSNGDRNQFVPLQQNQPESRNFFRQQTNTLNQPVQSSIDNEFIPLQNSDTNFRQDTTGATTPNPAFCKDCCNVNESPCTKCCDISPLLSTAVLKSSSG